MGIDAAQISRQTRSVPGRLTANAIKRGALLYWTSLFTMSAAIIHLVGVLKQPPQSVLLVALLFCFTIVQAITAVSIIAFPTRRLLFAAAVIEGTGVLVWSIAHTTGLPDGLTIWHPETLNLPDLYLPALEGVSAFFLLCLAGRTWSTVSREWRITVAALPYFFLLGILLWVALNFNTAQLFVVIFILDGGFPTSLQVFFFPAVGLLALLLLLWLILPYLRARMPGAWRTVLVLLPALLIVNIITWTGSVDAATTAWFPASAPLRAPAGQTTMLEYCLSSGGSPLAMDLTEPSAQAARPAPVVFYIHGGEGLQGSRTLEDGSLDGVYFTQFRDDLVSRGFAVGAIDYGLFPEYKLLDEVKEAKCAVRFLRAHASDLGIDPQRIGVYGVSMGGYISSMLGTVGPQAGFDVGQYMDQSSRVEAVIDMWGPSDLTNWSGSPSWVSSIGKGLSAGTGKGAIRLVSPVNYVAPGDPPFLIMHGTDDWFIAPHHSQDLAKLLHGAGVPVTLVMIQHDEHGLAVPTPGQVEQPAPATLVQMMRDFFVKMLAG
jgi:acetyl esterase/lipase